MAAALRLRTRWSPAAVAAFERAFGPWMRRRLRSVHLTGLPAELPADRPLVLVANHASWWDGFVLREVQRALRPRAPLYTAMTGAELRRFPFFALLGAVDVGPRSPAALLRAFRMLTAERTHRPDLCVAVFPQGRMWPARRRPLGFQRGVATIARLLAPAIVLPVAIEYETFASPAPSAFVSAGDPLHVRRTLDLDELQDAVALELARVASFLDQYGERSASAWPGPAGRLPAPAADAEALDLMLAGLGRAALDGDHRISILRRSRRPNRPRGPSA